MRCKSYREDILRGSYDNDDFMFMLRVRDVAFPLNHFPFDWRRIQLHILRLMPAYHVPDSHKFKQLHHLVRSDTAHVSSMRLILNTHACKVSLAERGPLHPERIPVVLYCI